MGKRRRILGILLSISILMGGCAGQEASQSTQDKANQEKVESEIVVGFSQVGAESDWRNVQTESMQKAFTADNGYKLLLENGQQKQANQIMAIRTFIQKGVDYIVLAPVVETGWDTFLQEAKDAEIPVILVDRMISVEDESLYTAWVGSDFQLEGEKVSEWIHQYLKNNNIENANIVNIQGTLGATAQLGRTRSLERACTSHENMTLLGEVSGDFTQARAREVMETLLTQYEDINIVYCENDNEAFGVVEAIEESGRTVGSDIAGGEIMIASFDGVNELAMKYVMEDRITCIAECNPLHGSRVETIISKLEAGQSVERLSYVNEGMYAHDNQVESIVIGGKTYPVEVVTQELLDKRPY